MTVTGDLGILKVGYRDAARIQAWRLVYDPDVLASLDSQLTARVKSVDSYWSTERPTELWLQLDIGVWWTWTSFELTSDIKLGGSITAIVSGAPTIISRH